MSYLTVRTTLRRSNPLVLREFMIDDSLTAAELLHAVSVVHEWEPAPELRLKKNRRTVSESEKLENLFSSALHPSANGKDNWCIDVIRPTAAQTKLSFSPSTGKSPSSTSSPEDSGIWVLRVEIAPYLPAVPPQLHALLLRTRGLSPRLTVCDLREWNMIHQDLQNEKYYYSYSTGTLRLNETLPDHRLINQRLRRITAPGEKLPLLDHSHAVPLTRLLDAIDYTGLKEVMTLVCGYQKLSSLTRQTIILMLKEKMDRDEFWEMILNSMSLSEYTRFREYCAAGSILARNYSFPSLARYHLTEKYPSGPVDLPSELLNFYEKLLAGDDGTLVLHKQVRETLTVCSRLYQIFPRPVWEKIVQIMYPAEAGRIISVGEPCWSTEYEGEEWKPLRKDLMCSRSVNDAAALSFFIRTFPKPNDYYLPDQQYAFRIAEDGMTFSKGIMPRLITALTSCRSYDFSNDSTDEEEIIRRLYAACQSGMSQERLKVFLNQFFYKIQSERLAIVLWGIIQPDLINVRRMDCLGYTQTEYRNRNARGSRLFRKE